MKKRLSIIPKYGYIPFICIILSSCFVFYVTRFITANMYHYDISTSVDDAIPFVPAFISIYVLAYVQWAVVLFMAMKYDRDFYYRSAAAEIGAKIFIFLFFVFMPTDMVRGEITGTGFFDWLTRLMYTIDQPNNLFPSMHCLDSWLCLRIAFKMKGVPSWFKWGNAAFSFLVFASVVLVKQHLFLDIFGGIMVAELGILLVKYLHFEKILYRLTPKSWL